MTIDPTPTPAASELDETSTSAQATDATETASVSDTTPEPTPTPEPAPEPTPEPEVAPVTEPEPAPTPVSDPTPAEAPVQAEAAPVEAAPVETAAPADEATTEEEAKPRDPSADKDLFLQYMAEMSDEKAADSADSGFKRLTKGERIEATISQIDRNQIFVQVPGSKTDAILKVEELSGIDPIATKDALKVGDKLVVVVTKADSRGGAPEVSQKKAEFEANWDKIEQALESKETLKAQVIERVKGGLVVDVGVRGFVPATHVGSGKLRNIEKYVGEELDLKVIEIDRERRKVVLSNRDAEEERRASAKDNIFQNVKAGDRLKGTVRRLADYGAFVDLGGVDGLLHISEMSWARITHPKEMFKEGQEIEVMVLRLDEGAGKISLGHRQVLPDPWNLIRDNYKNGQKLTVTVNRLVASGAFIRLPEGAEAFMPVSEMSFRRIKRPQDVLEEGQENVECVIIDLRPDERRMVLSIKATGVGAELRPGVVESTSGYEEDMRRSDRGRPGMGGPRGVGGAPAREERGSRGGAATGGATIGERLGALRGLLGGGGGDETPADE